MISINKNFAYIHIPKTGGTSVTSSLLEFSKNKSIHQHTDMVWIKKNLGNKFDDCFKFTFVRNPFDRIVSFYCYRKAQNDWTNTLNKSFEEFVYEDIYNRKNDPFIGNQIDWLKLNREVKCNFIGRFENLQQDFNEVCRIVGIQNRTLDKLNQSNHRNYQEYYNSNTIN